MKTVRIIRKVISAIAVLLFIAAGQFFPARSAGNGRQIRLVPEHIPADEAYGELWLAVHSTLEPWLKTTDEVDLEGKRREISIVLIDRGSANKSGKLFMISIYFDLARESSEIEFRIKSKEDADRAVEATKQAMREIFPRPEKKAASKPAPRAPDAGSGGVFLFSFSIFYSPINNLSFSCATSHNPCQLRPFCAG